MKFLHNFNVYFILIICVCYNYLNAADSSPCADWLPYKDEKCYKIVDDSLRTFADAEKICESLDGSPTLPIIRTSEEQDFLFTYLFKTAKKVDNFWIGAKFSNRFKWIDNSELSYVNWDQKGAKNKDNYCVQIQADDAVQGKWIDESCERSNKVVCQKMQTWSLARLQEEFLNERKQHRDALDLKEKTLTQKLENVNKDLLNQLTSTKAKLTETATLLSNSEKKIENLEKNPIPIGFIYVQLSSQPEPKTLWSTVQWKDVTSEYAGLFFRAEGGDSAQFGTVQQGNAPRVTDVVLSWFYGNQGLTNTYNTTMVAGGVSSGLGVFSGNYLGDHDGYTHKFHQSGGEVRPRNSAMRIWKRIN